MISDVSLGEHSADAEETIRALQAELADTNRGLMALTLELEQRVDERTTELRAAHAELQRTNAELLHLTLELESRVAERTEQIQKLNEELEQRVADRTAELAAANRELEAFSSAVSHDLRAPLRHIAGFSGLLADEFGPQLDRRAVEHIERIQGAVRKMTALIEDLLALSRLSHRALQRKPTDLCSLVQEVANDLQTDTNKRCIEWRIGPLPVIACDPGLMKQVLSNLLSNAIKFTRSRDCALIQIGERVIDEEVVFFVQDNGVGFDMKYAEKLFRPFERLHNEKEFEGTGVGLSTVQRIIHKHGGHIWAESAPGAGTTFFFTLPRLS